jgi:RHS repeat-associated protein
VGNKIGTTDRNGRKTSYSYDALNRQTAENWLDGNNNNIHTLGYQYDAVGHLLTTTNPDSKYAYTYDAVDRITSIDNSGTVGVPAVKFNYSYDAAGNLLTVTDSINGTNAGITGYTYDRLNRVTQLNQSGTGVQAKRADMGYNALNQLINLSRYSNNNSVFESDYVYDNNQRLIKLSHNKGSNVIANYDYSYDAADKLAQTVSSTDGTSSYSYDATNQLTGTDNSTQTDEAYSYDANGNRTNSGYQTGTNNQLLSDGVYNYQYDDEGNRTKRTEIATGKVTEYNWDYRNRLTQVVFKDVAGVVSKTIEYTYDGNNQRIGKKIDGVTTERYVIDRNQIALVFDGAGNQTHRYLYGTQIDQVLADETSTGMVWALGDNQGTVRDLIDDGGNLVEHLSYDSFGKLSNASITGFRYGYTGREQDSETGLDYYRARYYDAGVGRFISEDPLGFAAGDPNIYRYVGNSPTNFVDPSGLQSATLSGESGFNPFAPVLPLLEGLGSGLYQGLDWVTKGTILNPLTVGNGEAPTRSVSKPVRRQDRNQQPDSPPKPFLKEEQNPNLINKCEEEERRKKCKSGKYLFRGDSRSPLPSSLALRDGIFAKGFISKGGYDNLEKHVFENPRNDIWISTSKDGKTGIKFATDFGKQSGYVYAICQPLLGEKTMITKDVNEKFGTKHKYAWQREIAFRSKIPSSQILLAIPFNKYGSPTGLPEFNPTYNPR